MPTIFPPSAWISNSQIAALLPSREGSCALRYAFERRFKFPSMGSLAMELGSALDDGANEALRPTLMGRSVDLERSVAAMWERIEKIPDDLADKEARAKEGAALEVALQAFALSTTDGMGRTFSSGSR